MPEQSETLIRVDKLAKRYGQRDVFSGVSC